MKNIKLAQQSLLDLLVKFHRLCEDNNIEYWLDGGSLLGAARNNKFIPWDDDIDLVLMPDDYDKLIVLLEKEITSKDKNYFCYDDLRYFKHFVNFFASFDTLKDNAYPYKIDLLQAKAIPNNTELIEQDRALTNVVNFCVAYEPLHDRTVDLGLLKKHLLSGNLLFREHKLLSFFITDYLKQYNKKDESYVYNYIFNDLYVSKPRPYYTHDQIFPLGEIELEGHKFKCPNNVDSYLQVLYGPNYMTPPPPEMRKPMAGKISKRVMPIFVHKLLLRIIYILKYFKSNYKSIRAAKKYYKAHS